MNWLKSGNLSVIGEKLDPAGRDSILKLGKLDDRLHTLEEGVVAEARTAVLPQQTTRTTVLKLVHQQGYLPVQ
jgi:hypothetical protein